MSKKMKKSSFMKSNKFAPLISDVLPYETPIRFSNTDFYKTIRSEYEQITKKYHYAKSKGLDCHEIPKSVTNFFIKDYLPQAVQNVLCYNKYTIPYNYKIKHGERDFRQMTLLHPIAQCEVCDFYEKYQDLIIYNTSKSKFSLRYPIKVSKIVHKQLPDNKIKLLKAWEDANSSQTVDVSETVIEDNDINEISDLLSTYFVYKKYTHLFKFYESFEYISNEKRFKYLVKLDIARFFNSLYTHSIEWAIKDKEYIKNNLNNYKNKENFGKSFDELMRISNYKETSGIPIGAEVSRIFAEIIMQDIDIKLEKTLNEIKIYDFKIYRYVDDYFIFYNEEKDYEKIHLLLKAELQKYSLFLNETKTAKFERPFITNQTLAKQKIKYLIETFLNSYYLIDDNSKLVFNKRNEIKSSSWFLTKFRILLKETNVLPIEVSHFVLSQVQRKLIFVFKKILNKEYIINETLIELYLSNLIDIIFYIYSISENASTSYKLYKTNYFIIEISKLINNRIFNNIEDKIRQETFMILEVIENKKNKILVEQLDIITLVQKLESANKKYQIDKNKLKHIFDFNEKSEISYFEIVILLDYIKNENKFIEIKNCILEILEKKFNIEKPLLRAENFMLFFDLIKSPYLTENDKKKILGYVGINSKEVNLINEINKKKWFYDWGKEISIKELLEVKEWTSTYI